MLKSILPQHVFGGKGPNIGPQLFMTGDDAAEKGVCKSNGPKVNSCFVYFISCRQCGGGYGPVNTRQKRKTESI
jgi:hypothetical protein